MKNSTHAFCCWIGTLPMIPVNFLLGNPKGGWAVIVLSVIVLIITIILRITENKEK